jgi:glutamate dehydrogenase (NAD(P)+)
LFFLLKKLPNPCKYRFYKKIGVSYLTLPDVSGGIYCEKGLDADEISKFLEIKGNYLKDYQNEGVLHISHEEVLTCECDVLIPAALENQINEENASRLRCSYIVEGANGPTTVEADKILKKRGVTIVPDIFANSGGVIVSYFEWVQNIQSLTWGRDEVKEMLEKIMTDAFIELQMETKRCGCTLRMAAYIVALKRLIYAEEIKGIFP